MQAVDGEARATPIPSRVALAREVEEALEMRRGLVALETAVVTHGLPSPYNEVAMELMERAVRAAGAVPATCLVTEGKLWIGASRDQTTTAACDPERQKASVRDLGTALVSGRTAGLTVSAAVFAAQLAGIRVFATGGIGGVHRGGTGDVSTDLIQFSRSPVVTVCSVAKSVLDIPRTLEMLETLGVPVVGYRTDRFPAFYVSSSGLSVPPCDAPASVADAARAQWSLGYEAGLVVGNPVPAEEAIGEEDWEAWLDGAEQSAHENGIIGKDLTPFLLAEVAALSGGRTVRANLALLESNARLAAEIAVALAA